MKVKLDFFGPGARLHHVGMVVKSIEAAVPGITGTEDPIQRVKVAFVDFAGLPVELVEPAGENSPVAAGLAKGNVLAHVCLEVPSLETAVAAGRMHGFSPISKPAPAVAINSRRILWMFSRVFGLIELVEAES